MSPKIVRRAPGPIRLLCWLLLLMIPAAAPAAVEIAFYSKEFGDSFPHAFVRLEGTLDANGAAVDANYGFTARHVSPAVLFGSVTGEIISAGHAYIADSDRHVSFVLSDQEYGVVLETVERWRTLDQPSYNLNRRNCVFFVADVARALGMVANTPPALMKKPRSYTEALVRDNRAWLEARGALFGGERQPEPQPAPTGP